MSLNHPSNCDETLGSCCGHARVGFCGPLQDHIGLYAFRLCLPLAIIFVRIKVGTRGSKGWVTMLRIKCSQFSLIIDKHV